MIVLLLPLTRIVFYPPCEYVCSNRSMREKTRMPGPVTSGLNPSVETVSYKTAFATARPSLDCLPGLR